MRVWGIRRQRNPTKTWTTSLRCLRSSGCAPPRQLLHSNELRIGRYGTVQKVVLTGVMTTSASPTRGKRASKERARITRSTSQYRGWTITSPMPYSAVSLVKGNRRGVTTRFGGTQGTTSRTFANEEKREEAKDLIVNAPKTPWYTNVHTHTHTL